MAAALSKKSGPGEGSADGGDASARPDRNEGSVRARTFTRAVSGTTAAMASKSSWVLMGLRT